MKKFSWVVPNWYLWDTDSLLLIPCQVLNHCHLCLSLFAVSTKAPPSKCKNLFKIWLTHFKPLLHFYTPWKRQRKPLVFWRFQGGTEMEHWRNALRLIFQKDKWQHMAIPQHICRHHLISRCCFYKWLPRVCWVRDHETKIEQPFYES